jgi:phosphoglycerol transferase MdoB-like AlkP superfamily enzyme
MIAKWKASPEWDNMLVVMIADHGLAYPDELQAGELPRQRIPMLWIGGAVKEPMVVEDYASQCDMAATLLAQMDIDVSEFEFSRNIFAAEQPRFGFWSYNNGFGLISKDGYIRHNLTNDTTTECEAATQISADSLRSAYERQGKAIVQSLHNDLIRR